MRNIYIETDENFRVTKIHRMPFDPNNGMGYTREELYDCIKEQANYISDCLRYRNDIDTEYGKLCYMFTIIKGSIKDITDRNRRNNHIEEIKREEVEIVEDHYEEVVVPTNKRKTLLGRLGGI